MTVTGILIIVLVVLLIIFVARRIWGEIRHLVPRQIQLGVYPHEFTVAVGGAISCVGAHQARMVRL
jgi:hypothetical protein